MTSKDPAVAAHHQDSRANATADWLALSAPVVEPPASAKARLLNSIESLEFIEAETAVESDAAGVAPTAELTTEADFVVETRDSGEWYSPAPGVRCKQLYTNSSGYRSTLMRMEAGSSFPAHVHRGIEEACVLEGRCEFDGVVLEAGDYYRAGAGTRHGVLSSSGGCLMIILEHGRGSR